MQYKQGILPLIFGISLLHVFTISDAYAYLDPASGMIIIQILFAALIGIGITLKVYWHKVKNKILGILKKD